MNSEFPNAPEDRLIDELLREQARGPDEAFLQQIENAIDAGPPQIVKPAPVRNYGRIGIAAGIGLAAAVSFFMHMQDRYSKTPVVVTRELRAMPQARGTLVDLQKPDEAVHDQEEKVEERSKQLATAERSKGIIYSGQDSYYGQSGNEDAQAANNRAPVDEKPAAAPALAIADAAASPQEMESLAKNTQTAGRSIRSRIVPNAKSASGGSIFASEQAPEPATGDRYGTFIDQPWKSPASDPLSTFSIDVDTASYSNVRRMIREGREIPKDAVRIEECINAFKYHYPAPKGDAPFAVGAALAICPWAPSHQLVRVAIKGRDIETDKRPASNLVFLIDVSGSMQSPDKLPLLQKSMATMVGQLGGNDKVAIVVYAGTEGVVLPSTRIDDEGRAKVLTALSNLAAGGSTNGGAGIRRAYEIAMEQKIEGGVNRVILATDGDFNVGVTGQQSLVSLVKERAQSGVYLTVAGFGSGNLNDAMMDAITHDGNGNYFYIDSEREGRKVFLQNLSGTLVTIAKDVKIQVEFNPAKVGGYRLIGYANRVLKNEDFNNDKVDAGDIGAGHTVTAFYELTPLGEAPAIDGLKYQAPSAKPATDEWLTVKLRYKHPDGDESSKIEFPLTGDALALDKTDTDFQFSTAAALFGMKLRDMDEVKDIAWGKVLELAKPGLADDATEDRAEFMELVKELGHLPATESNGIIPKGAEDNKELEGPDVRIIPEEDGSRTVFVRTTDRKSLIKKTYVANGALAMVATYKMDGMGHPVGCKIKDAQGNELFKVAYGYHKETGRLVEERMFDSRVKRIDPDTGKEDPIQKVAYTYGADGKRSLPIISNHLPGVSFEKLFGRTSTALENNPFDEADGKSESGDNGPGFHPISPPAEVIPNR